MERLGERRRHGRDRGQAGHRRTMYHCGPMAEPTLLADLEEFVTLHRPHGELRAVASPATPNGYRLEVACPCSVVFERWVFPEDAAIDMALRARWN